MNPIANKDTHVSMLPAQQDEPWQPMPGESNRWYDRFSRYLALGAGSRSVRAVYQAEKGLSVSKSVPASWTQAAHRFAWQRRAEAYDDTERRRRFSLGNAADTERVKKLDELAERMYGRLSAGLDSMEVNEKFLAQFLAVLDMLARHTGGYAPTRHELTGKDGKDIEIHSEDEQVLRVLFYFPEVASLPDQMEQVADPSATLGELADG